MREHTKIVPDDQPGKNESNSDQKEIESLQKEIQTLEAQLLSDEDKYK